MSLRSLALTISTSRHVPSPCPTLHGMTLSLVCAHITSRCTGTNPRAPLIKDLRQLMLDAWDGLAEEQIDNWVANE